MMEICMLSELFYPFLAGGAERRYYEIAKRLSKNHNVTVHSLRFAGYPKRENHEGVEIVRTGARHPIDKRNVPALLTYYPALLRSIAGDYDLIDANQGIASFSGAFKAITKKPVIATFHDIYWNQFGKYFPFPLSAMGKAMEFTWSRLPYTNIITVSPTTQKKLVRLGFKPQIKVIPSGVDGALIRNVRAKRRGRKIVFVGRLVGYKNVDTLIRAFSAVRKECKDAELHIIGSGPEEENLRALAKNIGVGVKFHGFVPEKEKIRLIKEASLLVNPSSVEGLGLILIESMACGTPVVARRLDTYFFCNQKNSLLYDDQGSMEKVMLEILENRRISRLMSKSGVETAKEFSWDRVAERIEELYRDACE